MIAAPPGGLVTRPAVVRRLVCGMLAILLMASPTRAADVVVPAGSIPPSLIVGRAQCGGASWLLTDARQLVRIRLDDRKAWVYPLLDLKAADRPWGLACPPATGLWTLADPRSLVRITADGHAVQRVPLPVPWIALFDWRGRFVFAPMPLIVASPLLASTASAELRDLRSWPALTVRAVPVRAEQLARNLATCGIANDIALPCWFADSRDVVLSDGIVRMTVRVPTAGSDPAAPVWDAAVVAADRLWVLLSGGLGMDGRRVGGRLQLVSIDGRVLATPEVDSRARLIVAASPTHCWLATVRGDVVRVSAP